VARALAKHFGCASEFTLKLLGGKWKSAILCLLKEGGTLRYGQLRTFLPRLSDKVLSERLKELEALGLVAKSATPGSNSTRYRLTERGDTLRAVLAALYQWGERHAAAYGVKCDNPVRAARKAGLGKK
jgi:DNA-binding HxlR family transcriptional regulator